MSSLKNKILIIGGCGYIGSSLFNFLQNKGLDIDTVDLEWFGNNSNVKNINIDYRNLTAEFLAKYGAIVLLAAHSSVKMCENSMLYSFNNNVRNFIDILTKINDQKFIYASSSSVYGVVDDVCNEKHGMSEPISFYDTTKQHIDQYALLSKKNYYGLRFGTVNGSSSNLRVDIMMNAMVNSIKNGGSINLVNPETKRPILYINDLNRSIYAIINAPDDHPGIYNLCSFNSNVGDIASGIARILSANIETKPSSNMSYSFMIDNTKFCNVYNFKFEGTIDKITYNLFSNYDECHKTNRNSEVMYV